MRFVNLLKIKGLLLIIVLFFIISSIGIFNDYSLNTGGDESVLMAATFKMISDQTLRPNYDTFYHVPMAAYFYLVPFIILFLLLRLLGIFTDFSSLKEFAIMNFYNFLPFARFITILMSIATIYLLYKISEKLFNNRWISLLATFLLSTSLMFVQLSHLARAWIPQTMTVLLAFYLIIALYKRQESRIKDYFLVGLGIGLAFGTHAIGVIVYASFITVSYLKNLSIKKLLLDKYFWLTNFIMVIFYFLTYYLNPYGFGNYINREGGILPNFNFLFEAGATPNVSAGNSLFVNVISSFKNFGYYINILIEWEPVLLLLFIAGSIVLFLKARKYFYIIASFILVYYVGVTFSGLIWYYLLPIIPFLALIAGYGFYYLYKVIKARVNNTIALVIVFFIFVLHFVPALAWDYLLIQPSPRLEARDWVYENIPSGNSIINFDPLLELNENQLSLTDLNKFASNFFTKKRTYLLSLPETTYPLPNYYILNYTYYEELPKELIDKKYDYLIIGWGDIKNLKVQLEQVKSFGLSATLLKRFPESADENIKYQDIRDQGRPIYAVLNGGISSPVIDIYKLE